MTLFLLEGNLPNPKTLGIIASDIKGDSFDWTPGTALAAGDDYLIEIMQGLEDINYSGQFSVQTAAAASATTIYAVAGSSTIAISTVGGNASSTATTSTVSSQAGASGASGTGISMARNTTFVSQSLTATKNVTVGTSTATVMSAGTTTVASSTTAAAGAPGSTSSSAGGGAVARATAQGVFGFGAVAAAAAVYLL